MCDQIKSFRKMLSKNSTKLLKRCPFHQSKYNFVFNFINNLYDYFWRYGLSQVIYGMFKNYHKCRILKRFFYKNRFFYLKVWFWDHEFKNCFVKLKDFVVFCKILTKNRPIILYLVTNLFKTTCASVTKNRLRSPEVIFFDLVIDLFQCFSQSYQSLNGLFRIIIFE